MPGPDTLSGNIFISTRGVSLGRRLGCCPNDVPTGELSGSKNRDTTIVSTHVLEPGANRVKIPIDRIPLGE